MDIKDILIYNIEENNKEGNINNDDYVKKPEKIIRFFKLSGRKDEEDHSDLISTYNKNNVYYIPGKNLNDIFNKLKINENDHYNTIGNLQNEITGNEYGFIKKFNELISNFNSNLDNFISIEQNELIEINHKNILQAINNFNDEEINDIYIVSEEGVNKDNTDEIIKIPKDYYIYSEDQINEIINKIKNINIEN